MDNKLYVVINVPVKDKVEPDRFIVELDMITKAVYVDFPIKELDESYKCFPAHKTAKDFIYDAIRQQETTDDSIKKVISGGIKPSDIFLQACYDGSIKRKL